MLKMNFWVFLFSILSTIVSMINCGIPCSELSSALKIPCHCKIEGKTSIAVDCDRVVITSEIPNIPLNAPVSTFSQRYSGLLAIPTQIFTVSNLPITKLDFSYNFIRGLHEKAFYGVKETLRELRLTDNLFGDSLNPIFSSIEFQSLNNLTILDLSRNKIKSIEEGILKGCSQLEEFYIDGNKLVEVPTNSLRGPMSLRVLSVKNNQINSIKSKAFTDQKSIEKVDLRFNKIAFIASDAFEKLTKIKEIYLAHNQLSRINSDVFEGMSSLQKLDLSENYFESFPSVSLKEIENLKVLNLSSNMIKHVEASHLQGIRALQILDLSRNSIVTIEPATFREQKNLRFLDLSLNSLRTIEDDAFEELDSLQTLIIRDNNILLIPGSALGRIGKLSNLYLDFNRVAALSSEILGSINAADIRYLSLSRNVIRELPGGSFSMFRNLIYLDLLGNSLTELSAEMFDGLENSLVELKLGQNKISTIGNIPLKLNQLRRLDVSHNNIVDLPKNTFQQLQNLIYLNMSSNSHLAPLPTSIINPLHRLQIVDLSNIGLRNLNSELLSMCPSLRVIVLKHNKINEIPEASFNNLRNCSSIDLSFNAITSIKPGAFINTMNLKMLNLRGNQLNAFKGEIFNTGTSLEEINLSENQISYIFQTSFKIHPRIRKIDLSQNKFNFFPASTILGLQFLEFLDLSQNQLKAVEELDFARLPKLRKLMLHENQLEIVSDMSFHNSSQLQYLDLSHNKIDRLGERIFEGFTRIEYLNLGYNQLTELPEGLFERSRVQTIEHLILSNNRFSDAPLRSLQKRNVFIDHLDLSHNQIREIPSDSRVLINVKKLDLSCNPLSVEAIESIFSEPKTVRELNMAKTGVKHVSQLETPFLQNLNLTDNHLVTIDERTFQRTPLLELLDISNNMLNNLQNLSKIWPLVSSLIALDISNNSFETISQGDFDELKALQSLSIHTQSKCTRIEKNAFKNLQSLSILKAYDFPILGYLDVKGILTELPGIETLDIEMKDSAIGSDQLQPSNHPRINELSIRGYRLKSVSSSAFAGLKSKNLCIKLQNTSLTNLFPAMFFPIPRSANVNLDISGSMITVLSSQMLSALEDRRNSLTLTGLNSNPIHCDCNARALRRWLPSSHMTNLKCYTPDDLHGRLLIEVGDDELTCNPKHSLGATASPLIEETASTLSPNSNYKSSSPTISREPQSFTTSEPEIIWSIPITHPAKIKSKVPNVKQPLTNDDTLIIGIVGAVVAFILILIIVICIVRLRISNGMVQMPPGAASVQLSYKTNPALYAVQQYAPQYATLPHMSQASLSAQSFPNTSPGFHQNQPFYVYQDEKNYR